MAVVPFLTLPRRLAVHQRRPMAIVGAVLVLASIVYGLKVCGSGGDQNPNPERTRSAFLRWYPQINELGTGVDIYAKYNYPNPPIMALLLRPLTALPPLPAALCWFYLKVAMTLLAVYWVWWLVQGDGPPFPVWAQGLTLVLALRPLLGDLEHGNINLFILFLVVGALTAFASGRDWLGGTVLGLAIACKVTPALFLPYLIWKRAWKCVAGCLVGLVLFLLVIPAGFLGEEQNNRLLGSWINTMVRPYVVEGKVFYSEQNNQSLPGYLTRMTTHSPSFTTYEGDNLIPLRYHNIAEIDPRWVGWITKGCLLAFLVLAAASSRSASEPRRGWRVAAEWSLVVLGMLLFSERTWKHHCVTLLLPFGVAVYYLAVHRLRPWLRRGLIATLIMVFLLMTATDPPRFDPSDLTTDWGKLAQVYGAYVWAFVLLLGALTAMLWAPEPVPVDPPATAEG